MVRRCYGDPAPPAWHGPLQETCHRRQDTQADSWSTGNSHLVFRWLQAAACQQPTPTQFARPPAGKALFSVPASSFLFVFYQFIDRGVVKSSSCLHPRVTHPAAASNIAVREPFTTFANVSFSSYWFRHGVCSYLSCFPYNTYVHAKKQEKSMTLLGNRTRTVMLLR